MKHTKNILLLLIALWPLVAAAQTPSQYNATVDNPALSQLQANPSGARSAMIVAPIDVTQRAPTVTDDWAAGYYVAGTVSSEW